MSKAALTVRMYRQALPTRALTMQIRQIGCSEGPLVVLLHGLAADGRLYLNVANMLAQRGYCCLLPDLRGHGKTPIGADPLSISSMAQDLCALIGTQTEQEVHVVGNSMGGIIAAAALQCGLRPTSLTINGTALNLDVPNWIMKLRRMMFAFLPSQLSRKLLVRAAAQSASGRQLIAQMMSEFPEQHLNLFDEVLRRYDFRDAVEQYPGPVLLIRGGQDNFVNRALATTEACLNRRAAITQIVELPKAGHCAHLDDSEAFLQALSNHFSKAHTADAAGGARAPSCSGEQFTP